MADTQVKALSLEIEGSTKTIEALLDVESAITKNAAAIKKLKADSDSAGKTLGNLTAENERLTKAGKILDTELDRVTKRMKELLSQNKQAGNEYKELKKLKAEYTAEVKTNADQLAKNEAAQKKHTSALEKAKKALIDYTAEQAKAKNSAALLRKEITNQAKDFDANAKKIPRDSIAGLTREYNKLIQVYEKLSKEERESAKGKEFERHLAKIGAEANKASLAVNNFKRNIGNYPGRNVTANITNFGKSALAAFGVGSELFLSVGLIQNATKTIFDFEQGLSKLSSITGLTGDALDFVGKKAVELSTRFGTSAVEMLRIFQLVGSAIPELLEDSKGLVRVAGDADILAKASGLAVDESVKAVSLLLAQYQLSTEKTGEIIDILATAAQKGKAEIPDLTAALENAGDTAAAFNIPLETTVASLEAMAAGGKKGSEAGIGLRNILLKLGKTGRDDLNPALRPLPDILRQLRDELGLLTDPAHAATKATVLFKAENVASALALIKNVDTLERLDGTLNDHGNALAQAMINTDNARGRIEKLTVAWEAMILAIDSGEGAFGNFFASFTDGLTRFLSDLRSDGFLKSLGLNYDNGADLFLDAITGGFILNPDNWKKQNKKSLDRMRAEQEVMAKEFLDKFGFEMPEEIVSGEQILGQFVMKLNDVTEDGEAAAKTLGKLTEELKELRAERLKLIPGEEDDEIEAIDKKIAALEKTLGKGGKTKKTIDDFAAGTIGFMNFKIKELNETLQNATDENVITKTTEQIVKLENAVEELQNKIALAKTEAGSLENIQLQISILKSDLQQEGDAAARIELQRKITALEAQALSIEESLKRIDNQNKPGLSIKDRLDLQLGVPENLFTKPTNDLFDRSPEEAEREREQTFEDEEQDRQERLAANQRFLDAKEEQEKAHNEAMATLFNEFGDIFADLFSGQEEDQKEIFKRLLIGLTKYAEAQIKISALAANTQATIAAFGNPALLAKLFVQKLLISAVISAAFGALRSLIQAFATGLEAGPVRGGVHSNNQVIKSGIPFRRPGSTDNVLIHAEVGERVVNKKQQKRGEELYGRDMWKNMMTTTGRRAVQNNVINHLSSPSETFAKFNHSDLVMMSAMMAAEVGDAVEARMTGNRIRERNKKKK